MQRAGAFQGPKSIAKRGLPSHGLVHHHARPRTTNLLLPALVLESEMGGLWEKRARDKIKIDPDAELHALRHRFLTGAGDNLRKWSNWQTHHLPVSL
jgi:UDP:flavonoid glycosyltransferase YjiC (YdhE family)